MELPQELKGLYRHWSSHTDKGERKLLSNDIFEDEELYNQISAFAHERLSIWRKKQKGEAAPYTTDPILSTYRFCNIFREFDRQTIEFHTLLNPLRDDFSLWLLNMFYCRMVARPETVRAVGLLSFGQKENEALLERLLASSRPRYGTPYVFPISVIQRSETPTRELFIARYLPKIMQCVAEEIEQWNQMTVVDGVKRVLSLFGFNLEFLWTEVLIDVAYQFPERINLYKQFPVGPGSAPTMKRINPAIEASLLVTDLAKLPFDTGITFNNKSLRLSAENWEGVGCEFRKYTNLSEGKGRKRRFAAN